jgi:hypothetical protein
MASKSIGIFLMTFVLFLFVNSGHTQARVNTREVMRAKLHYAQGVLEGLATENFSLIKTNAQRLSALSQSADWRLRQTVEYQKFTTDFNRQAMALEKLAGENNLDGATVAYFQLTVSCVQCHKYLRGAREAKGTFELPGTGNKQLN